MAEIFTTLESTSPDDSKYVDFGKYFDVFQTELKDIALQECGDDNLIEIYRAENLTHPFCKNSNLKNIDRPKLYSYLKKKGFKLVTSLFQGSCYTEKDSVFLLVAPDKRFMVAIEEWGDDSKVKFLYKQQDAAHLKLIDKIIGFSIAKDEKGKVFMLIKSYGELELRDFNIKNVPLDLDNYNDDFAEANDKIVKFANSEQSGLCLLYSAPGMGKTFYLRSLVNLTKNKVVFISREAVSAFSSPDFLGFAIDKLKDCVLYLEDCDTLLSVDGARTDAAVNLLQLSDGLTGDLIRPKIIATFNCKLDAIDGACLRRGRLKLKYNFEPLSVEKSNRLLKKLGKDKTTKIPMSLADIYNDEDNGSDESTKNKFGF